MSSIDNQDMIQAFFSDGAYPAFCKGIGIRSTIRGVDDINVLGEKTVSNIAENLVSLSWIRKRKCESV